MDERIRTKGGMGVGKARGTKDCGGKARSKVGRGGRDQRRVGQARSKDDTNKRKGWEG